jgi:hypothetical protein
MSHDRFPARPLARWLLPSSGFGTDLQKAHRVTATHCFVTSSQTKNTYPFLVAAWVLRALYNNGFTCHIIMPCSDLNNVKSNVFFFQNILHNANVT